MKCMYDDYQHGKDPCHDEQEHVHEFLGSTKIAEKSTDPHNHRFAGVTGEAIYCGGSHVHKIRTTTDFYDHYHSICTTTGPAVDVGNGKHVHLAKDTTTTNDGHAHDFIFATLIEKPLI